MYMDFKELQTKVVKAYDLFLERDGIVPTKEYAAMKLVEEVGEFMQAALGQDGMLRKSKMKSQEESDAHAAEELADVVGLAMVNANLRNLDIVSALERKWLKDAGIVSN